MRTTGLILVVLFAACYSPSLPNGKQECGATGACPTGYQCAGDHHCYKMGQLPPGGGIDMAVPVGDMAMSCTAMSCKTGPKPFCDGASGLCVDCITDDNCPSGKVCSNKACVPGCSTMHGCPDGGGMCDVNSKMCKVCTGDGDCGGGTPRCDTNSGQCVVCLPAMDNCAMGKFCGQVNGVYQCQTGCQMVTDCPTSDGGGKVACCNHVCVDTDVDGTNCGGCGTNCGGEACCGGFCSDVTKDLANCGMCGFACAGKHASWGCMTSMCAVTSCTMGFGDCNGSSADGCEATLATDPANCGMCSMKCSAQNAVANCVASVCGIGMCNAGFGNCDNNPGNGCETNVNGDIANCGMCGMKCSFTNAAAACVAGKCVLGMCNIGFSDCDNNPNNGCEAATASDVNNCGGCNIKCGAVPNATVGCAGSKCVITGCTNGMKDCDMTEANGCESNPVTDVNNCGMCGTRCMPGANVAAAGCAASACTITSCNAGFANCNNAVGDGCEINTTNDKNHCGNCNIICGVNQSCVNSVCGAAMVKVLVLAGESTAAWVTDVQQKLIATGAFTAVDVFVTTNATPTVAQLQPYDSILVFSDGGGYLDAVTVGNNLATYYDNGGHVVIMTFANVSGFTPTGNFGVVANGYLLMNPVAQGASANDSLGAILEPGSPLLTGVAAFTTTSGYKNMGGVVNGGIVVAQWASGAPLVIRGLIKGRNRCDLNFFPPSVAQRADFWSGDGANLMRNCLLYR